MTAEEEIAKLEALLKTVEGVGGYSKRETAIKARLKELRDE